MSTAIYKIDPLQDPRWPAFVEGHPNASVFHTAGWLEAIYRTYGYKAVAFSTSPPTGTLKDAIVFASVRSWLTGRRIVSLPFSDHCAPLFDSSEELNLVLSHLQTDMDGRRLKYMEIRPMDGNLTGQVSQFGFRPATSYYMHRVDLRPALNDIFKSFDKDSVQRRIRRAERAQLIEKRGRSEELLKGFYDLLILTRKRHRIPPQPYVWFQNILECLGDAAEIRLAYSKDGTPVAAIFVLRFKDTVVYKYGASNEKFKNLGATQLLFWRVIEEAKANGANEFDLGRSQESNPGLIAFKDKWTKHSTRLVYWRSPPPSAVSSAEGWKLQLLKHVFACMPNRLLTATGRSVYRHIG